MAHSSARQQKKDYFKKWIRIFRKENGWNFIIFAIIISGIVCYVAAGREDASFEVWRDARSGYFAILCAGIWMGVFNSIQSICKERSIVQHEHRSGMYVPSYIISLFRFQIFICFVQALILFGFFMIFARDLPKNGVILFPALEYFITFFLVILSSDAMGIFVSSMVKTSQTAMTTMPFILILQLVLADVIFDLSGVAKLIANITVSKWGMAALGSIGNVNKLAEEENEKTANLPGAAEIVEEIESKWDYTHEPAHLLLVWGILLLFIVLFLVISTIRLSFIDKENYRN